MDINNIYLLISIILGILNIYQFFEKRSELKIREFLLANWHNITEGMRNAQFQIVQNPNSFTDKADVINSVNVISQITSSLANAMEEQRFYSTKQVLKNRQEQKQKFEENMRILQSRFSNPVVAESQVPANNTKTKNKK